MQVTIDYNIIEMKEELLTLTTTPHLIEGQAGVETTPQTA
jgi:hypothetical protein